MPGLGSQFWVVKPELGLIKTSNLETLVTGQYIEVQPAAKNLGPQKELRGPGQSAGIGQTGSRLEPGLERGPPWFAENRGAGDVP